MYAAVPETVGRSGREPAAVRDGNMKSNPPNDLPRNPAGNPTRDSARSPAR